MTKKKSGKTFPAWRKLASYNKIYLDPFLKFIGEDGNFIVIKSNFGVSSEILAFKKNTSVMVEPIEWDEKSKPILTLGGYAKILKLETYKGYETLSYPMKKEELSNGLKDEMLKEKI